MLRRQQPPVCPAGEVLLIENAISSGDIEILQYRWNANSFLFLLLFFFSVKKKRSVAPCETGWLLWRITQGTPPPASLVPLPFQGRLITANLQTPYQIKLTACTRKHLNINITGTGKGNNRRWQAPGGQRVQRANSAGRFRHGCMRSYTARKNPSTSFAGTPPLSGEAYA